MYLYSYADDVIVGDEVLVPEIEQVIPACVSQISDQTMEGNFTSTNSIASLL